MANFNAITSSNTVTITDVDAIEEVLENYCLTGASAEIIHVDQLSFYGYGWLMVSKYTDRETGEVSEDYGYADLLSELAPFIAEGETLDLQMVGNEKLRFPLAAARYTVQDGVVKQHTLDDGGQVVEPNAQPEIETA